MKKLIGLCILSLGFAACSALNSGSVPAPASCLENAGIACAVQSWGDQVLFAKCMQAATQVCIAPSPVATPVATPAK